MTFRSRRLLDVAREGPCALRIPGVCQDGAHSSVPAHSNHLRHGRRKDHKSHDCFAISACNECHRWYDEGPADRETKTQAFSDALERHWLWLWVAGKIRVA